LRREREQDRQQRDDRVLRDLNDKSQVTTIALDGVEHQRTGDDRQRGEEQKPDDCHASDRN
jgi:hypothetical protein